MTIDAVQKADSGHAGLPLGMAPVAYTLWTRFLRYDPADPDWPNRDRFVLSAGHGSMLLYALLHLAGVKRLDEQGRVQVNIGTGYRGLSETGSDRGLKPRCRCACKSNKIHSKGSVGPHQVSHEGFDRAGI